MLRLGLLWGLLCLLLSGSIDTAIADPAVERGDYLVNSILACGNCHSPRDANGEIIKDKVLSGGRVFSTPAFVVATSNITPDPETGIGSWTDAEIKRALIEGIRPDHDRLAGVPLAAIMPANFYKALLPEDLDAIVAYLRSVKPVRNEISDPVYKAPVHRDPYPDAETGFDKSMFADPVRRGAYLVTIGHCMECHSAWSRGVSDFKTGLGRGGRAFSDSRPRRERPPPTSPRTAPPASAPGAIRKSCAPSPMAWPATGGCSSRRWPTAFYAGLKGSRSRRHRCLFADGSAAAMMPSATRAPIPKFA